MKTNSIILALTLAASAFFPCAAQQTKLLTADKFNDYGVVYSLPVTSLLVEVTATREVRHAGPYFQYAKKYVGYNYASGGTTPSNGFDCSGFVYYVYNACGYSLSRLCSIQAKTGTEVSKSNLIPGDLVFFNNGSNGSIGHVAIYVGNGIIVHAANTRRGVTTDTINSGYYNTYYYTARRAF